MSDPFLSEMNLLDADPSDIFYEDDDVSEDEVYDFDDLSDGVPFASAYDF